MSIWNCNTCNREIIKDENPNEWPRPKNKLWEIWKYEVSGEVYEVTVQLDHYEKIILPKLANKYPSEHQRLKTILSKAKDIEKQFLKPFLEKKEEVLWKFFYKKGKVLPHFNTSSGSSSSKDEMCETCSAELEKQLKPHAMDEIEEERIMKKFEEMGAKEVGEITEGKFSEQEQEEINEEWKKLCEEFLRNKEKELNNKIIAERERERENWQGCQYQLDSMNHR